VINPAIALDTLDLQQAINYAIEHNRELARSTNAIESRSLSVQGSKAAFTLSVIPTIETDLQNDDQSSYGLAAHKKLIWGTSINVSANQISSASSSEYPGEYRSENLRVELEQPIFRNFGPLVQGENIAQADSDLKSARRRFEVLKANLVMEVVWTFEEIVRLTHRMASDNKTYERLDALYQVTKAKEVLGKITRVDTLRVELLRGEALSRLEITDERLTSLKRDFGELLGVDGVGFELVPNADLDFNKHQPDEAISIALRNRLDYAQAQQDYEDATRNTFIAKRQFLPDIKLVARYRQSSNDVYPYSPGNRDNFIGLSFRTDLNLSRKRIALSQSKIEKTSAAETIDILKHIVVREVQQQLQVINRTRREVKIAERNMNLASSRLKLAHRLFEMGRGDNFSVTDAEQSMLHAENKVFSARAEARVSSYGLPHVLGTLIEVDVGLKPVGVGR
jgi:outer membrane protein TolC